MKPILLVALLAALLGIPTAGAAGPAFHDQGTFTDEVDPNFCGTGESIDVAGRFNVVGWVDETGQELRVRFNYSVTLTNPDTGASIVDSGAGLVTNQIIQGLESGAHTHLFVESGLRAKLKLANGGVLTHDAGQLTYTVSFDANDNFTGLEVISVYGPHPAFQTDAWCDAATEALGIG